MRQGGILIRTACLLIATLASYAAAQDRAGRCAAEYDEWFKALADLRNQLEVYGQVKGESLEPGIMDRLRKSSGTETTMARIVQSALREHEQKVAEADKKVRRAADQERYAWASRRACLRSSRSRSNKSDKALLQTALEARRDVLKELDRLN